MHPTKIKLVPKGFDVSREHTASIFSVKEQVKKETGTDKEWPSDMFV
jgi:hypothetical protein